jgi:hypothetical protein
MEVILRNGELSINVVSVSFKWKHDFSTLFQNVNLSNMSVKVHDIDSMHKTISYLMIASLYLKLNGYCIL